MLLWATLLDHKMPSSPQTCLPAGTKIPGKSATQYHLLTALRASVPRYLLSISLQASFSEDWLALQCPLLVRGLGNLTFVETSILSDFYPSWNFMRSHQFLVTGEYVNWNEGENHNGKNKCLHKRILSLPYIYLQSRYQWFGWQFSFCLLTSPYVGVLVAFLCVFCIIYTLFRVQSQTYLFFCSPSKLLPWYTETSITDHFSHPRLKKLSGTSVGLNFLLLHSEGIV